MSAYEQAVTVADHASAPFLTNAERGQLKAMFRRALTGTDGNLVTAADGTAYVRTGDIPAEWLRDSSAQVQPYLYFAQSDKAIAAKVKAVIERQALYIAVDPYANAFRDDFSVWERKFELDSLSYPILLAWTYWKVTGDASVFTPAVKAAFERVLETMLVEQDHDGSRPGNRPSTYHFESDTQASGKNPVAYTGMIWTAFRPSDDECLYNFLIPAQLQAVQALTALAEMETFIGRAGQAEKALKLGAEVQSGVEKFGVIDTLDHGRIYAYEVDGLGNVNLMDDANVPSLLSLPYFASVANADPVYKATRAFILSPANPYFYNGMLRGREMSGIGSMHTPPGMIWPLSQVMQGMTANNKPEQIKMLKMLLASNPGDDRLHESYMPDDPKKFTREEFDWVNRLFSEFVLTSINGLPPLPTPAPPL